MKTTDNQNELFDIVDHEDNVIGRATRRQVHADKNLIHRSVGIIVYNKKGEIFLQQRSKTKDTEPLKWALSAAGHVNTKVKSHPDLVGTKVKNTDQNANVYKEAAHRELREELGVDMDIIPIGKYICRAPWETEMQMLYRAIAEGPFVLHPQEIAQGTFFTQKDIDRLYREGKLDLSFSAKMSLAKIGLKL